MTDDVVKMVRDLRLAGVTFQQIARFCKCSPSTVEKIHYGLTRNPRWTIGRDIQKFHRVICEMKGQVT